MLTHTEIREEILNKLLNDFAAEGPVKVKGGIAFISKFLDQETGRNIPIEITVTLKNTQRRGAQYSLEKAAAAYKPPKPARTYVPAPQPTQKEIEASAARERREANLDILRRWVNTHMRAEDRFTTTEIKAAIPEFESMSVMQVGAYLSLLVTEKLLTYRLDEKRKRRYMLETKK